MFNAEAYIAAALRSVLQETSIPLEVIVIDDCSSDRSVEQVQRLQDQRITLLRGEQKGIAATMNIGLAAANGQFIMRCDADDLFKPGRILEQVTWLQQHPDVGAVCGSYDIITSGGAFVLQHATGSEPEWVTDELSQGITRTHLGTYAIRTEILRQIGGFRDYFETGEDIDLQLRLAEACSVFYQPESRYCYRLHDHSITHVIPSERRVFFDRIARTFQNQRQTQGWDDLQEGIYPPKPTGGRSPSFTSSEQIQGFLQGRSWQLFEQERWGAALRTGLRSLLTRPSNPNAWKNFSILVSKVGLLLCQRGGLRRSALKHVRRSLQSAPAAESKTSQPSTHPQNSGTSEPPLVCSDRAGHHPSDRP